MKSDKLKCKPVDVSTNERIAVYLQWVNASLFLYAYVKGFWGKDWDAVWAALCLLCTGVAFSKSIFVLIPKYTAAEPIHREKDTESKDI